MEQKLMLLVYIGITILVLSVLYRFFRCKHAWELVDKTQLPSRLEEMRKFWAPDKMLVDDVIRAAKVCATLVVRCPRCGHCKIIRMSNED